MGRLNINNFSPAERGTVALVTLLTLIHLLVAGQFELSGDESHYVLYAYHLDWSYFDHPPLVGWILATVLPFSDSEFALRLWPIALSVISSWLLYRLTQRLYPESSPWVPAIAVALLQSSIIFHLLSLALLPDTPLLTLGLASALLLHRAVIDGEHRTWLWIGLLFGLAGLSKYTAVLLVMSTLLLIVWGGWRQLLNPWLWIGVALAALLITPVLWWNYSNDWISFLYQFNHGMPQSGWSIKRLGISFAGQLITYGPLLVISGIAAGIAGLRESKHRFVLLMALPLLLFFGWNSGYELSLPHWTLLGWALLLPLSAHWLVSNQHLRTVRLLIWGGAIYSALLLTILLSSLFQPWLPFEEGQYPLADLYGWKQTAQRAVVLAAEHPTKDGDTPAIFAGNWSFASHIAWYARPVPVRVTDKQYSQSDIWFGAPQAGEQGILVVPAQFRDNRDSNGLNHFRQCDLLERIPVILNEKTATSNELYYCQG
ncbi:MAG: glycosyltransferase family 39 protein, partial [Chromatiales bacterium]|nr:glycosyltransferase family 39 protein [Chromatiales bacterium]